MRDRLQRYHDIKGDIVLWSAYIPLVRKSGQNKTTHKNRIFYKVLFD